LHDIGDVLLEGGRINHIATDFDLKYGSIRDSSKFVNHTAVNIFFRLTVPVITFPPPDADRPASTLSKEDFPAPLGPIMAQV
jgi:hypothetical protein